MLVLLIITCMHFSNTLLSQDKKRIEITETQIAPKIDGSLEDNCWEGIPTAKDFFQFVPYNGNPATEKTEVKIIYDNNAVYIAAKMFDSHPDSIYTTLTKRDAGFESETDVFMIQLSTFNDGINASIFMVTAAGVQTDIKVSNNDEDLNWDAVWESAIKIVDDGWTAEIKLPYSALRFTGEENQVWGINMVRNINRKREWSSWNWVDNKIDGFVNQMGVINAPKGIKPPLRLSFTPYFSTYAQHDSEEDLWTKGIKGGMDLKYGISESFTLDMMLIPDFSQVQTDDEILNLSAFEVRYEERRPFFTEGTELFNKGGIFYSKRIGSEPKYSEDAEDDLGENEDILENPIETKIVNATKITGRSQKGLGVGFFNAITLETTAKIKDSITDTQREYRTQPFTNYNILVLDQSLKNNSFISLINTNMIMPDNNYTANVTASEFLIRNKRQSFLFRGGAGLSQIYEKDIDTEYGFKYEFGFAKTSGNIRYSIDQELVDDKFDPNDMGFLRYNNFIETEADISYRTLQPKGKILEWFIRFDTEHQMQFSTANYMQWQIGMNTSVTFTNNWSFGFFADAILLGEDDYYESRKDGQVYIIPPSAYAGTYLGSDSRKKLSFDAFVMYRKYSTDYARNSYYFEFEPSWRANDRLRISFELSSEVQNNNIGFVDEIDDIIYFGKRDRKTIASALILDYTFNNKMSLSLRGRHYWSSAVYKQFYTLNTDGNLSQYLQYTENEDINFNSFNIDMVYTWRFAPGSDILIVWKNSISEEKEIVTSDYFRNLSKTFDASQTNLFSIKVLYYLDYLYLKRKK